MSITRSRFNRQCLEFANACRICDEDWKVYQVKCGKLSTFNRLNENLCNIDDIQLVLTKTYVKKSDISNKLQAFEYHVIYSESFEVPVMYLDANNQDGSPLDFDEIIPLMSEEGYNYSSLSQVEHPLLFRPYFMVHPCHTADFMALHRKDNGHIDKYLICWLSTVSTLIGLKLKPELFQLMEENK